MIRATILLATIGLPVLLHAQRTRALEQIASTMAGSYTSAEQAKTDTSYFEIELEMVRIWPKRRDGAWFYVEQATADSKAKPYRQRVYHVQEVNDSTFTSNILTIKGGECGLEEGAILGFHGVRIAWLQTSERTISAVVPPLRHKAADLRRMPSGRPPDLLIPFRMRRASKGAPPIFRRTIRGQCCVVVPTELCPRRSHAENWQADRVFFSCEMV
jgi:hypothetical protein